MKKCTLHTGTDRGTYKKKPPYVSHTNASFEINISYGARKGLESYFEKGGDSHGENEAKKEDKVEIDIDRGWSENDKMHRTICVFDKACKEVFGLLMDSFTRFVQTPVYGQLCDAHLKGGKKKKTGN